MSLCAFENIPPINKRLHVIVVRHMIGKIYLSEIEVEIGVIPNLLTVSTFPIWLVIISQKKTIWTTHISPMANHCTQAIFLNFVIITGLDTGLDTKLIIIA